MGLNLTGVEIAIEHAALWAVERLDLALGA